MPVDDSILLRQLERDSFQPDRIQEAALMRILTKNKDSEYGREHAFSGISGPRDFKKSAPVVEYPALEPYIAKIMQGRQQILTSEPVTMFTRTSGTTSDPKYIPVTASSRRRTALLMRQWLDRALLDHPSFLDKGFLMIAGAAVEGRLDSGIPYGSMSGMIYASLPNEIRRRFVIPLCVNKVSDYDLRYYLMARIAFGRQVSFIVTPSPLTLLKLAETAIARQEELIRSIHNGWLSESLRTSRDCIAAGVPQSLRASISPDRKRARFLSGVFERDGELLPCRCWPELSLIGCWLGGSIGFHADSLGRYYGKTPKRDIGYMASEGCFNLPCQDSTPSGVLALRNNYYEFIPEDQSGSRTPDILSASELKEGVCYKMLLTNESGLYRYDMNDIVKVNGFHNRTPIISFVRKDGSFLNIAGEKLHINHFLAAVGALKTDYLIDVRQFRAVPDYGRLRYEMLLDIRTKANSAFIKKTLCPALDSLLRKCNIEYDAKRKSGRLNAPCIHVMKRSWEEELRKVHLSSQGRRDIQYKWLHISERFLESDRPYIERTID